MWCLVRCRSPGATHPTVTRGLPRLTLNILVIHESCKRMPARNSLCAVLGAAWLIVASCVPNASTGTSDDDHGSSADPTESSTSSQLTTTFTAGSLIIPLDNQFQDA